ncbi:hypothetical protein [Actinokineospora sp.]|uniref:hypothetical protein n=1 Tax=Actinokineospora sp. TaxID=1872133 RepID=UPI00403838D4
MTRKLLAALAGAALAFGALTSPATATEAKGADFSVQGSWACTIPTGKTYTRAQNNYNVCAPFGWAHSFYVETPYSGLSACLIPSGFTYSRAQNNYNLCAPSGWAHSYVLQVPRSGLWVCFVPAGFSASRTQRNYNVCAPNGWADSYLLV